MSVETIEDASKFIRKWMEDREAFEGEIATEGSYFHYEGIGDRCCFCIVQPKEMKRVIGVMSSPDITENYKKNLERLDPIERKKFFIDVEKELMFLPIYTTIHLENEGEDKDEPTSIFLVREISFDELSEGKLNEASNIISRAVNLISLIFLKRFGEPEGEEGNE